MIELKGSNKSTTATFFCDIFIEENLLSYLDSFVEYISCLKTLTPLKREITVVKDLTLTVEKLVETLKQKYSDLIGKKSITI